MALGSSDETITHTREIYLLSKYLKGIDKELCIAIGKEYKIISKQLNTMIKKWIQYKPTNWSDVLILLLSESPINPVLGQLLLYSTDDSGGHVLILTIILLKLRIFRLLDKYIANRLE